MAAHEKIKDVIQGAVTETFESIAFMQVTYKGVGGQTWNGQDQVWARVDVISPGKGFLLIACTWRMAEEIVDSIFGPTAEPRSEDTVFDALSELVNTAIGRCMAALTPEERTFELGLPETGRGWPEALEGEIHIFTAQHSERLLVGADFSSADG